MTTIRRRRVALGPHDLDVTHRDDGTIVVRAKEPLGAYARAMPDRLVHWAAVRPTTTYLAERTADGEDWRRLSYAQALVAVRACAQGLLDHGCTPERGVAILSANSIDHALVALAAQYAGVPYTPISTAYSLRSRDFAKLRHCLTLFEPALIFADDADAFAPACRDAVDAPVPLVVSRGALAGRATIALASLLATVPRAAVDTAYAALCGETVAKILFTSGSTGMPKGVINTQRMMCSNQQMSLQAFPFWADENVMLDWVPWNHTAGSNQTFNMMLANGGTMYIDDGKPTPSEFWKTLRNLREISPTIFFNVPRGYDELARALEADGSLRRTFFRRLKMMWYAGAALSAPIFDHMRRLAFEETGEEILMTSGLGSTETAPSALFANFYTDVSGNVGVPVPGIAMKLVPLDEKLELRFAGPSITPGYLKRDDLTAAAFDEEGYYKMGDAARPVDPHDFSRGFLFDGRIGEDFKLATGTWVSVGTLRTALIAALQPLVQDVIVCGADRGELALLLVGDANGARTVAGDADLSDDDAFAHPLVRGFVATALSTHVQHHPGSSTRVRRALFLDAPPSIDAGEITDKGSLNNAIVRARRAHLIERLYAADGHPHVIAIP